ncbi:MAG: cytochrome c [Cyclobacteriaceae bacterium]
MMHLSKTLFIGVLILFSACSTSSNKENKDNKSSSSSQDEIRLKQYIVKGGDIYSLYCANCHQKEGQGLANLFPPLAGSDYLLSDLERAACVIKKGLVEEIEVNGKKYNQMMPPNDHLTPLEVAEVLTYITNSWGNEKGLIGVKDVESWLSACK